jgi:hypothetical protein
MPNLANLVISNVPGPQAPLYAAGVRMETYWPSPLGPNAEAVADKQHPDHQLRINRGAPDIAIVRRQMRPNFGQVDETVDPAQHMTVGDVPLQAEAIEQRLLHHPPLAHHRPNLLSQGEGNQR